MNEVYEADVRRSSLTDTRQSVVATESECITTLGDSPKPSLVPKLDLSKVHAEHSDSEDEPRAHPRRL